MYIALSIVALAALLFAIGYLYQVIGSHRDRERFAAPGRSVELGDGHRLYMLEKGSGGPTVLFEAGIWGANAAPTARDVIKAYFDKKARLTHPQQQIALFNGPGR